MKRFALALASVLACTALAFAAPDGSGPETRPPKAAKTAKSVKRHKAPAKAKTHASPAREAAQDYPRSGDITITGKAGSVTQVTYGPGAKSEPVTGKPGQ